MNKKNIVSQVKELEVFYKKKKISYEKFMQRLDTLIKNQKTIKEIRLLLIEFADKNLSLKSDTAHSYYWHVYSALFCKLYHHENSTLQDLEFLVEILKQTGWYSLSGEYHEKTNEYQQNHYDIYSCLLKALIKRTRSKTKLWKIHDFCVGDKRFSNQFPGFWAKCIKKITPKISEQWEVEYMYKNAMYVDLSFADDFNQRVKNKENYWELYYWYASSTKYGDSLLDIIGNLSQDPEEVWKVKNLITDEQKQDLLLKKYIDLKLLQ